MGSYKYMMLRVMGAKDLSAVRNQLPRSFERHILAM